ncbi:MAG: SWIM zinc finger family protein [Ilumatobacteraceae bacterium]
MGIVVVPGRFSAPVDQVGKLAHTLLGVAMASIADRQRLQRGRLLLAERAVVRLEVEPGVLRAMVQGSRPEPYPVVVTVPMVARPTVRNGVPERSALTTLVPDVAEVLTSCGCPDRDEPCKHSIAAVLAFADELTMRPSLLVEWRCLPTDAPRATLGPAGRRPTLRLATDADLQSAGSPGRDPASGDSSDRRSSSGSGSLSARPLGDHIRSDAAGSSVAREQLAMRTAGWHEFVGTLPVPFAPALPDDRPPLGRSVLGMVDLSEWLSTAHDVMREQ